MYKKSNGCIFIVLFLFNIIYSQAYLKADNAENALEISKKMNKYLIILVNNKDNSSFREVQNTIKTFQTDSKSKHNIYHLDMNNEKELPFIDKYGLRNAPMPLTLVLAPNGLVTGGFPNTVNSEQLSSSTEVSELILKVMKSMQDRKIALVCLQNQNTKYNKESTLAVNNFKSTPGYQEFIDIIKADPLDIKNKLFLQQAGIQEKINEATVVFVMPPGRIINIYKGNITKDDLAKSLQACTSGSGCCPPLK